MNPNFGTSFSVQAHLERTADLETFRQLAPANQTRESLSTFEQLENLTIPTQNIDDQSQSLTLRERASALRKRMSDRWIRLNFPAGMVMNTFIEETDDHMLNPELSKWTKADVASTAMLGTGGQVYERFRVPEVFGTWLTLRTYKEMVSNGYNTGLATAAGALTLGAAVYAQQKIIGKNWVKTAKYFPQTYDKVNEMWPKTMEAIADVVPNSNAVAEGYGMFALGTTPYIASEKVRNPDVTIEELKDIERRVTRRGSIFSAGVGATVLGGISLAPHIPDTADLPIQTSLGTLEMENVSLVGLREFMVDGIRSTIDFVTDPKLLIPTLGIYAVGKTIYKMRNTKEPAEIPTDQTAAA